MNKKDLAGLKRNFKFDNEDFRFGRIVRAYVSKTGDQADIRWQQQSDFDQMGDEEMEFHLDLFKKTLSGQLGKGITQYPFVRNSAGQTARDTLKAFRDGRLIEEEDGREFMDYLIRHYPAEGSFYAAAAVCEYLIRPKHSDGSKSQQDPVSYVFLCAAFCEAALTSIGLVYDPAQSAVVRKVNTEMQIRKVPRDGFIYPVLSDGQTEISSVLYYTSQPKKPCRGMIENMLGARFDLSSDEQQAAFCGILQSLDETALPTFREVSALQDVLTEAEAENRDEPDSLVLGKKEARTIFDSAGLDDEKMDRFDKVWNEKLQGIRLQAANTIDTRKIELEMDGIKVSVKADHKDSLRVEEIDGRSCLVLAFDGSVRFNGIEVSAG